MSLGYASMKAHNFIGLCSFGIQTSLDRENDREPGENNFPPILVQRSGGVACDLIPSLPTL